MNELINEQATLSSSGKIGVKTYISISAVVLILMMLFGLMMRLAQSQWLDITPNIFYQVLTAHGIGMVGIMGLASSAILWYFLSNHVKLSTTILFTNLTLFLTGVVLILGSIFIGGFGAAWTFLFPLPSYGLGMWGTTAAATYLVGLLLIGVGFLLLYLDVGRAILTKYGSFSQTLGWPQLFANKDLKNMPPAAVVASTMVLIVNILGIIAGAVVVVLMLINLFVPSFEIDPLFAKNLIYFFGHVFINAVIYQAVITVYEILPKYTNRPWKVNKVFLAAWTASTLMVLTVYPHHLLMDFAMPQWMLVMGQIISYTSGFPVLLVTAYGALTIVFRSGIKWDVIAGFLFLSMFGWAGGVIPAIIDGMVAVNNVMHNTLWVPGHFHMYLILGSLSMVFAFMYYLVNYKTENTTAPIDKFAYWIFAIGGTGFITMFLISGSVSVPRRWAVHFPEWITYSQIASVFAGLILVASLIICTSFLVKLKNPKPV